MTYLACFLSYSHQVNTNSRIMGLTLKQIQKGIRNPFIFDSSMKNIKNITVVGSGTMGSGIAHCFAQYGFEVNLVDLSQEALKAALVKIEVNLDRQLKKDIINLEEKTAALARIRPMTVLEEAVEGQI